MIVTQYAHGFHTNYSLFYDVAIFGNSYFLFCACTERIAPVNLQQSFSAVFNKTI